MVLQRSMLDWRESICHRYMYIVLYIERSAMRCAKFGVAVCKASMLDWRRGAMCHRYMCHCSIYRERGAITCAKFGVVVFKTSMLDCKQSNVPWVYVHCTIYETYLV